VSVNPARLPCIDKHPGLTIQPTAYDKRTLQVENKVLGQGKGIIHNGQVVVTMSHHEFWSHLRREEIVNVAAGMDILLALGMCYVRYDKQLTDQKIANAGAANASSSGAAVAGVV